MPPIKNLAVWHLQDVEGDGKPALDDDQMKIIAHMKYPSLQTGREIEHAFRREITEFRQKFDFLVASGILVDISPGGAGVYALSPEFRFDEQGAPVLGVDGELFDTSLTDAQLSLLSFISTLQTESPSGEIKSTFSNQDLMSRNDIWVKARLAEQEIEDPSKRENEKLRLDLLYCDGYRDLVARKIIIHSEGVFFIHPLFEIDFKGKTVKVKGNFGNL